MEQNLGRSDVKALLEVYNRILFSAYKDRVSRWPRVILKKKVRDDESTCEVKETVVVDESLCLSVAAVLCTFLDAIAHSLIWFNFRFTDEDWAPSFARKDDYNQQDGGQRRHRRHDVIWRWLVHLLGIRLYESREEEEENAHDEMRCHLCLRCAQHVSFVLSRLEGRCWPVFEIPRILATMTRWLPAKSNRLLESALTSAAVLVKHECANTKGVIDASDVDENVNKGRRCFFVDSPVNTSELLDNIGLSRSLRCFLRLKTRHQVSCNCHSVRQYSPQVAASLLEEVYAFAQSAFPFLTEKPWPVATAAASVTSDADDVAGDTEVFPLGYDRHTFASAMRSYVHAVGHRLANDCRRCVLRRTGPKEIGGRLGAGSLADKGHGILAAGSNDVSSLPPPSIAPAAAGHDDVFFAAVNYVSSWLCNTAEPEIRRRWPGRTFCRVFPFASCLFMALFPVEFTFPGMEPYAEMDAGQAERSLSAYRVTLSSSLGDSTKDVSGGKTKKMEEGRQRQGEMTARQLPETRRKRSREMSKVEKDELQTDREEGDEKRQANEDDDDDDADLMKCPWGESTTPSKCRYFEYAGKEPAETSPPPTDHCTQTSRFPTPPPPPPLSSPSLELSHHQDHRESRRMARKAYNPLRDGKDAKAVAEMEESLRRHRERSRSAAKSSAASMPQVEAQSQSRGRYAEYVLVEWTSDFVCPGKKNREYVRGSSSASSYLEKLVRVACRGQGDSGIPQEADAYALFVDGEEVQELEESCLGEFAAGARKARRDKMTNRDTAGASSSPPLLVSFEPRKVRYRIFVGSKRYGGYSFSCQKSAAVEENEEFECEDEKEKMREKDNRGRESPFLPVVTGETTTAQTLERLFKDVGIPAKIGSCIVVNGTLATWKDRLMLPGSNTIRTFTEFHCCLSLTPFGDPTILEDHIAVEDTSEPLLPAISGWCNTYGVDVVAESLLCEGAPLTGGTTCEDVVTTVAGSRDDESHVLSVRLARPRQNFQEIPIVRTVVAVRVDGRPLRKLSVKLKVTESLRSALFPAVKTLLKGRESLTVFDPTGNEISTSLRFFEAGLRKSDLITVSLDKKPTHHLLVLLRDRWQQQHRHRLPSFYVLSSFPLTSIDDTGERAKEDRPTSKNWKKGKRTAALRGHSEANPVIIVSDDEA